ncbi:sulfite exporter TauE/SafE family protein [Croceitalea sp. MTPC9]|uniref:sulfite exporter TauE/SafE family protein n=1 Tax=unclassified Croceitalea TaxID=2632280 RepID=UPI002B3BE566|nr:sulfite exporter TauE/SafE family protein [Croceitalea sp. MTPC6]GMN15727.1 sulfite exporter TauE/SafE family protein [Croceitalea sp. MTPC9]
MFLEISELSGLMLIFFFVALFYASVGFGGGSSYLALLTLFITSFFVIRSVALLCNLMVVSGSCYLFFKKGHLEFKKFLPFIVTSIPLAFIGASFRLSEAIFFSILGVTLIISAVALIIQSIQLKSNYVSVKYPKYTSYLLGGVIGLLSGLVGIGGGIFLAPILNHLKWEKPITIAALASFFILVNSVSGLTGLMVNGTLELFWPEIIGLLLAVFVGGQIGVRLTLSKFSGKRIRILTAILVLFVGVRVLLNNGLQINFFS